MVACAAVLLRQSCACGAAVLLLANWAANTLLADWTGTQFCWPAMSGIDFLTGCTLLAGHCPPVRLAIVALLAVELIAHSGFGFSNEGPWAQYYYWWTLHYTAWAQAWLVMGWIGFDGGKAALRRASVRSVVAADEMRRARSVRRDC